MKVVPPSSYVLSLPDFNPTVAHLPYDVEVRVNNALVIHKESVAALGSLEFVLPIHNRFCQNIEVHIKTACGNYYRTFTFDPCFTYLRKGDLDAYSEAACFHYIDPAQTPEELPCFPAQYLSWQYGAARRDKGSVTVIASRQAVPGLSYADVYIDVRSDDLIDTIDSSITVIPETKDQTPPQMYATNWSVLPDLRKVYDVHIEEVGTVADPLIGGLYPSVKPANRLRIYDSCVCLLKKAIRIRDKITAHTASPLTQPECVAETGSVMGMRTQGEAQIRHAGIVRDCLQAAETVKTSPVEARFQTQLCVSSGYYDPCTVMLVSGIDHHSSTNGVMSQTVAAGTSTIDAVSDAQGLFSAVRNAVVVEEVSARTVNPLYKSWFDDSLKAIFRLPPQSSLRVQTYTDKGASTQAFLFDWRVKYLGEAGLGEEPAEPKDSFADRLTFKESYHITKPNTIRISADDTLWFEESQSSTIPPVFYLNASDVVSFAETDAVAVPDVWILADWQAWAEKVLDNPLAGMDVETLFRYLNRQFREGMILQDMWKTAEWEAFLSAYPLDDLEETLAVLNVVYPNGLPLSSI